MVPKKKSWLHPWNQFSATIVCCYKAFFRFILTANTLFIYFIFFFIKKEQDSFLIDSFNIKATGVDFIVQFMLFYGVHFWYCLKPF